MPEEDAGLRRPGGRPKLRTSCDECGAAKLRCDRGQPECGRCVSHGVPCVYGVSKKMGKPPRQKLRSTSAPGPADPATQACDSSTVDDLLDLDGPFHQTALSLSAFPAFDFSEWPPVEGDLNIDPFNASLLSDTPDSYGTQFASLLVEQNKALSADDVSPHHECSRSAYEMLGRLSLFDDQSHGMALAADEVPFDHVLRLSREASEQLSKLLACTCAPCPDLAFLKASIVSKILSWYHQAAVCVQGATSHAATAIPNSVAPSSIAVGTFSVDDERVQAALKIQLLLGEMRRAALLIDRFNVHGTYSVDQSNPDGVDYLYKHLTTWLRGEHSRILQVMRSKLREVNN